MKRRSRGEQMLAAAGVAPSLGVDKVRQQIVNAQDEGLKSPPTKRLRATAAKNDSQGCALLRTVSEIEKPQHLAVKLPVELELLANIFDALRTGRMMLRRRSEKVTYNSVRHVVENMTKRDFLVEHLAQIKYLRPQAFDWQYIRTPSASNPKQMEVQLLLTFDGSGSAAGAEQPGGSVGRYSGATELAEFRAQLEEYAKANPVDPETGKAQPIQQAPLPPRPTAAGSTPTRGAPLSHGGLSSPATGAGGRALAAGAACASGLLRVASCPPGILTDAQVPGGALAGLGSPANSMNSGMSGASPSIARSSPRMDLAAGGPVPPSLTPIVEGNTPAASRASLSSQQSQQAEGASGGWPGVHMSEADVVLDEDDNLEQDGGTLREQVAAEGPIMELTQREGCVSTAQRMGFSGAAAVGSGMGVSTPQSKGPRPQGLQTTPTSHQPSGDARMARLHSLLSPAAMQRILEVEASQATQTPEAKRRAEMRRAVHLLPHGHELVRLIFGLQGPVVKPLTQVSQMMCERSTQRQGLSVKDASNTLVAMARAVPEFLRIDEPRVIADGSSRPRSVVISRAVNINAVAAKLKTLAADPDAAMQCLFLERGSAAADAAVRGESPGHVAASPSSRPVSDSPLARLKPRSLAMALEDNAFSAAGGAAGETTTVSGNRIGMGFQSTVAEMPPLTPSSRRRPPGLPLAPQSPMASRGGVQTPTRSVAARPQAPGGRSILASHMSNAAGPLPVPSGSGVGNAAAAAVTGGSELLQKLCRTGTAAVGGTAASPQRLPAGANDKSGGVAFGSPGSKVAGDNGQVLSRTPGRVAAGGQLRGRTAVQEVMLDSIRRSSAKRSCRKLLEGELEVGNDEEEPVPRRLEESLVG